MAATFQLDAFQNDAFEAGGGAPQTLSPPLVSNSQTFFAAAVSQTTPSQALTPSLVTNSQTFYAATLTRGAVTLAPTLLASGQTFYSASVGQSGAPQGLTPSLYSNAPTFYAATLTATRSLTPSLLTNAAAFYAPGLGATYSLSPALYSGGQTFYAPAASAATTLTPSLVASGQTFYAATLTQLGQPQSLSAALYANAETFYAPAVLRGAVTLDAALYANAPVFYPPTVGAGGATAQALECLDYVDSGYVDDGYVAWPAFNTQTFFAATLARRFPGFEVDIEPATWWTRKPKAEPPEQARAKLQAVAQVVSQAAQEHLEERASRTWRKAEVRARLEPLIQDMPGFDWVAMYDRAYSTLLALEIRGRLDDADRLARQEIDRIRARHEDDVVALLLAL